MHSYKSKPNYIKHAILDSKVQNEEASFHHAIVAASQQYSLALHQITGISNNKKEQDKTYPLSSRPLFPETIALFHLKVNETIASISLKTIWATDFVKDILRFTLLYIH